jgi:hypothetical protein
VEGWLVVHVIVAAVLVTLVEVTALIVGIGSPPAQVRSVIE